MKKAVALLFAIIFFITACGNADLPEMPEEAVILEPLITIIAPPATTTPPTITTPLTTTTTTTTPPPEPEPREPADLSVLRLFNYEICEENYIWLLYLNYMEPLPPNDFRKYFFGTWESEKPRTITFDDTVKNHFRGIHYDYHYNAEYNAVIYNTFTPIDGVNTFFWIYCDEPDKMYITHLDSYYHEIPRYYMRFPNDKYHEPDVSVYKIVDRNVAEPEDGYLSDLSLREIQLDYGINSNLLYDIEFGNFVRDNDFFNMPIFLLLKTTDKFVFKTVLINYDGNQYIPTDDDIIEIIYTIEKTDDEWVRSIEVQ